MKKTLALLFIFIFSACSASAPKKSHPFSKTSFGKKGRKYNVSVATDGTSVSDFGTSLVHRVNISPRELELVSDIRNRRLYLPFSVVPQRDVHGQIAGLFLSQSPGLKNDVTLGFEDSDLITAVGRRFTKTPKDLWFLIEELRSKKEATATIQRGGRPHKIFYYLSPQS